jgi:hypothetical protein
VRIILFEPRDNSHNKETGLNKYGGIKIQLLSFLTAALDGGEWGSVTTQLML